LNAKKREALEFSADEKRHIRRKESFLRRVSRELSSAIGDPMAVQFRASGKTGFQLAEPRGTA
jgi:hypothetical protein